ncbi:MAG: hypothetical protein AAGL89_12265 [Pseudomonadota bacterium]
MSKAQPNINLHAAPALELIYATVPDHDAHAWPIEIVLGFLSVANGGSSSRVVRACQISAAILKSLPVDRFEFINANYVIPALVTEAIKAMGDTVVWPERKSPMRWPEASQEDLDAFSVACSAALRAYVDAQARQVIDASPRALLRQAWSGLSALQILGEETPDPADHPFVERYRAKADLSDLKGAATAILETGRVWALADTWLDTLADQAADRMANAQSIAEVKAIHDEARNNVDQVVAQVLSGQAAA